MSFSSPVNIAFLFGSGISLPVGMPKTTEITERILSGKDIYHASTNYYFGKPIGANAVFPDEYVPRVVKFLNRIKDEIDCYYLNQLGRVTNYEDLYYVASQIRDSELREYDNPVVQAFIDKVLPQIKPLLVSKEGELKDEWHLRELAIESAHYIKDVVWRMLSKKPSNLDRLDCIKDACLDDQFNIDMFTLNHDTVLEKWLFNSKIQPINGFDEPQNDVRYWQPKLFNNNSAKVRLFKLHGSINWFRFRPDEGSQEDESIGISLKGDIYHTRNPKGQRQLPVDGRPMFLAGTFNKLFSYTSSIYSELHCQFHHALNKTERIIICGYGFGDKGINSRIFEWIHASTNHRIILIHHNSEELKKKARGVLINNWDDLVTLNKLIVINKRIEKTSWKDIKEYM